MPTTKNDKQNPIDGATNWGVITGELHTIELQTDKGIYGFYLKQYPRSIATTTLNDISTGVATGTTLTIGLSGVPQQGIVRVDFTNKTGWVWCHQNDVGKTISCDYQGGGYVGHEENLEEIITEIATPIAEASGETGAQNFVGDRPTDKRTKGRVPSNAADTDHDLTFSAGHYYGTDGIGYTASAITKQIDATWAKGTNQGGLDTGVVANNTWYYAHEIIQTSTGDDDVILSTSSTSGGVTMPVGWTHKRVMLEWLIRTDGSANIRGMLYFETGRMNWKTPPQLDFDTTTLGTTRTNATILAPTGSWEVEINWQTSQAAGFAVYISNPDLTDLAVSTTVVPLASAGLAAATVNYGTWSGVTDDQSQLSVVSGGTNTTFRSCVTSLRRAA